MRITSFHINGFGVFTDVALESLSPRINLFYGDNESGKSTLLAFIRSVFFGFPDGRSHENIYPPLFGRKHGGRITLLDDEDNRVDVERFAGFRKPKIQYRHKNRDESTLASVVLKAENRNLFKNIFAFSLAELQNFESLSRGSIQEALYSASAGIDPQSLPRLKSLLERRNDELFKPMGRNPGMNRIINRLTVIQNEKKMLNSAVDEYDRILFRLRELDRKITADEEKRINLLKEIKQLERWLSVWPEYINLSRAETKLGAIDKVDHFPARGLSRFESIREKIEEINREWREREKKYQQLESELLFLGPENRILKCEAKIKYIKRDQGRLDAVLQDLISTGRELAECESRLETSLANLGKGWTEVRIRDFDLSLARREEIRRLRDRLQQGQRKKEGSIELHENLGRKRDEWQERFNNVRMSETDNPELLNSKKERLKRLKNNIAAAHDLDRELDYLEERLADLAEEKKLPEEMKISGMGPWLERVGHVLFIVSAPLLIFFGFHLGRQAVLAILTPLAVLLILIRLFKQRSDQETGRQKEDIRQRIDRVIDKNEKLDQKRDALLSQKEKVNRETEDLMKFLLLEKKPSLEELDKKVEEIESGIEQLNLAGSIKEKIEDIEKKLREAGEKRAESEQQHQEAICNWSNWLKEHLLDQALSPEGALETLSLVESCREQVERIRRLRSLLSSLVGTKNKILETVNQVVSFLSREPIKEEDLQIVVHDLILEFEKAEKDRQQRGLLIKDQKDCSGGLQELGERKKGLLAELAELMGRAGVKQEEEFIRHAEIYEKRQGLLRDIERYRDSLFRLTRDLEKPDRVMERMSAMNLDDLEGRKALLDKDLKTLEGGLEHLKEERAKSEERSQRLSVDERAGEIRYEEQTLKEELAVAAEEWSVNRLALSLIRMARARFERDRQPDVIKEAARIFQQMTLGRYHTLIAPIGENTIEILDQDNTRKGINQLSRGTAEQLYLSLRFGFIREFSRHSPALPVIMDDILVNFDPRRAAATIRGMIELSRSHQILFFTCHPETTDLFKKAGVKDMFFHVSKENIYELKTR